MREEDKLLTDDEQVTEPLEEVTLNEADVDKQELKFSGSENLLNSYFRSIRKYPLLTAAQEVEYGIAAQNGDEKAREIMITRNLRLVVKIALDYKNRGVPILDLIEEGNLGLIHAVSKFDPHKGFRFSTYATYWIKQNIEQAVMTQPRLVKLPINILREIKTILKVRHKLQLEYPNEVGVTQLAAHLDKDPAHVRELLNLFESTMVNDVSQYKDSDDGKELSLLDILPDQHNPSHMDMVNADELKEIIKRWYKNLSDNQKLVVLNRFGLDDSDIITLEKLGNQINLTRERVRQIQNELLCGLKKMFEEYGIDRESFFRDGEHN